MRWGVQLGISQGRKTCRPWDLRAPHSGQPPSRPQHFREPPPRGGAKQARVPLCRRALGRPCRAPAQCGPLPAPLSHRPLSRPARPSLGSASSLGSQPPLCLAAASPVSSSMFSWVSKDARRKKEPELFQTVSEGLRRLYAQKLLPLEEHHRFHEFHSAALENADFENKPMVLLVGQYSTGKTTFIRRLMEQDFPGMRIGPEPTIAVMHGPTEGVVPGNALVVDPRRPFRKLNLRQRLPQQAS
ncbi:EH domain-containing protein 1-like [Oryx dammah]|uniref:EH domain-containing protein 1-like n=1 Tax=Oryx dammah TaxID=59534 RepID=UPI001A9B394B|nr:EH domain-containing protein 1-like [Oryx dammah]